MRLARPAACRRAKVWDSLMHPTNFLTASPFDDIMSVGGAGAVRALSGLAATIAVGAPRPARREGGPLGADAGAETGPYSILTRDSGSRSRQVVAEELLAAHYPKLAG